MLQSGSKGFRATSLPAGNAVYGPRSSGLGRHPGGHSFPLAQPPPDVNAHPNEFQARRSTGSPQQWIPVFHRVAPDLVAGLGRKMVHCANAGDDQQLCVGFKKHFSRKQ